MTVTLQILIAMGMGPTQARLFVDHLAAACQMFGINTPARLAAFYGQIHVESAGFTSLEENLNYRTPERLRAVFPSRVPDLATAARLVAGGPKAIANRVYSGRLGNGDEASGDGWRYRGRGLKQLTGRANYEAAAIELRRPYVTDPDLVSQPADACLTAASFWAAQGCNALADAWNLDAITRAVNGPARLKAVERRQLAENALDALRGRL